MTDQQAEIPADELERIRNYLGVWPVTVGMETPGGVPLAKQLLAHADALSARLAQAEQAARDFRNDALNEMKARRHVQARLREYEEALIEIAEWYEPTKPTTATGPSNVARVVLGRESDG